MSLSTTTSTRIAPERRILFLFIGLMITMLMSSLNQTVFATALPTMIGELNGVEHMSWVITAFILASTITMPIYGKLSDLLGRKPLLIAAILLFGLGSVLGAFAMDMELLIVARVVQGLGGGGLMVLSQAAIADVVPARERGKYMGVMGGVFAISSVAGPLLGGWLTEGPGWRWAFWMNLPLALLSVLATIFLLHLPKPVHAKRPSIDYPGMALLSLATTSLVLIISWGGSAYEWTSPQIIGLILLTLAAAIAFLVVESRVSEPVIPLKLFRDRNFNLSTISGLLTSVAMFGVLGYFPTYLQMATGASATEAGLLMIPMMGALLLTSVLVGQMVSRTGRYKWLPVWGTVIVGVAMLLLSTITVQTPVMLLSLYLAVLGAGLGASMQILVLIVQNSFPQSMVGTATAANNYFRQVGATLGSAVVGSLFSARLIGLLGERFPGGAQLGDGAGSLTPDFVQSLPAAVRLPVIETFNEALIPLFLLMTPLAIVAALALAFIKEVPLATTIDDELADAAAGLPAAGLPGAGLPVVPEEDEEDETARSATTPAGS